MIIIPAIDLRSGRCVRLTQGRKDQQKIYDSDPVAVAERFEQDGAQLLHIVDLDAAFGEDNTVNQRVLRALLHRTNIAIQLGGGLRHTADVDRAIELGVHRVVLGTVAVEHPEILEQMIRLSPQHIVVGIDANHGQVVTHAWETKQSMNAVDLARRVARAGVQRVVYTDVQRDGMLTGPNIAQACRIAATGVIVTASGGVASLNDIQAINSSSDCGIDSVIVGKALYEGRFTLPEAIASVS